LRLLDVVGLPELVIQLATSAITEAGDDWKSQVRTNCILLITLELYHGYGVLISVLFSPVFDT
jgi:nuclear pore complex protein Nup160